MTVFGRRSPEPSELASLLREQAAYYCAVAGEYEDHAIPGSWGSELPDALDGFAPAGHVLEIACGPGTWTSQLLRHASGITAVDASAEMIEIASARVNDERVRFIHADIFDWTPAELYDVVFFGFWLSHIPLERFEPFWSLVGDCLAPEGRVFFLDDAYRTSEELVYGESSSIIRRRLKGGSEFRILKVPHRTDDLTRRLEALGWDVTVTPTSGPFFWGAGRPARSILSTR